MTEDAREHMVRDVRFDEVMDGGLGVVRQDSGDVIFVPGGGDDFLPVVYPSHGGLVDPHDVLAALGFREQHRARPVTAALVVTVTGLSVEPPPAPGVCVHDFVVRHAGPCGVWFGIVLSQYIDFTSFEYAPGEQIGMVNTTSQVPRYETFYDWPRPLIRFSG